MNKLLFCAALLAMSYIVSADVPVYALPLTNTDVTKDQLTYLSMITETADGNFYYDDKAADGTPSLQVWNSNTNAQGTAMNVTIVAAQIAAFVKPLTSQNTLLQSIGNAPYVAVGYKNGTKAGIRLFPLQADTNVTTYDLPSSVGNSGNQVNFTARVCQTTDGKFYYYDQDSTGAPILQVWDSNTKAQGTPIPLTNLITQATAFLASLGGNFTSAFYLQGLGTTVYLNMAYTSTNKTGIEVFLVQADVNAPTYGLPSLRTDFASDLESFETDTCSTADGKWYYMDIDLAALSAILQVWDSKSQTNAASISLTDVNTQGKAFIDGLGNNTSTTTVLQCLGNNVYLNVAWSNKQASGIELFLVKKSAGILSFSYAALFVAVIALLF